MPVTLRDQRLCNEPPPAPFFKIRCTVGFELCVEQELRYEDMTAVKIHV